ncbi:MAG: hypothetical protein HUU21_00580 [Polyangiaceae bacterium]|nr:hypothetical protein [Polyangiaceae bacterium]
MNKGRGEDRMEAFLRRALRAAEWDSTVRLQIHPQHADAHNKSPDFVVDAEIRIPLFPHHPLLVRVPLLVEVEAGAGFSGGLEDLYRFIKRASLNVDPLGARIDLPFIIATEAEAGNELRIEDKLPVRFLAQEIPIPDNEGESS